MRVEGDTNLLWQDVLRNGPSSRFAPFFDIDWEKEINCCRFFDIKGRRRPRTEPCAL
jgi:maltooligosyltrehalose synthase